MVELKQVACSVRACMVEQNVSRVPLREPNSSNREYTSFTLHTHIRVTYNQMSATRLSPVLLNTFAPYIIELSLGDC